MQTLNNVVCLNFLLRHLILSINTIEPFEQLEKKLNKTQTIFESFLIFLEIAWYKASQTRGESKKLFHR